MTVLAEPTNLPPMKTAGTEGLQPRRMRAHSISLPRASSSSSYTAGPTPCSYISLFIAWLIPHELLLNITTAFCDASFAILSISDLSSSCIYIYVSVYVCLFTCIYDDVNINVPWYLVSVQRSMMLACLMMLFRERQRRWRGFVWCWYAVLWCHWRLKGSRIYIYIRSGEGILYMRNISILISLIRRMILYK